MQNNFSKFILSNFANEFLNDFYIRLVIFLSILFIYIYIYIYNDYIFLKYHIF